MSEWLVWIKDLRDRPRTREQVRSTLSEEMRRSSLILLEQPSRIYPMEEHPGEWCLRIGADPLESPTSVCLQVDRVTSETGFGVRVLPQPAPPKAHSPHRRIGA